MLWWTQTGDDQETSLRRELIAHTLEHMILVSTVDEVQSYPSGLAIVLNNHHQQHSSSIVMLCTAALTVLNHLFTSDSEERIFILVLHSGPVGKKTTLSMSAGKQTAFGEKAGISVFDSLFNLSIDYLTKNILQFNNLNLTWETPSTHSDFPLQRGKYLKCVKWNHDKQRANLSTDLIWKRERERYLARNWPT